MASGTLLFDYANRVKGGDMKSAQQDLAITTGISALPVGRLFAPKSAAPVTKLYDDVAGSIRNRAMGRTQGNPKLMTRTEREVGKDFEKTQQKVMKKRYNKARDQLEEEAFKKYRQKEIMKDAWKGNVLNQTRMGNAENYLRMGLKLKKALQKAWESKGVTKAITASEVVSAADNIQDEQGKSTIREMQNRHKKRLIKPTQVEGIRAEGYVDPLIRGKY